MEVFDSRRQTHRATFMHFASLFGSVRDMIAVKGKEGGGEGGGGGEGMEK